MKLQVPFYRQTTILNCGPCALKMVFSFLGKDYDLEIIENAVGIKEGKGVSTIRLAIASAELGFKTELLSKCIYFNEQNLSLDFYKAYGDMNLEESKRLVEEAKAKGAKLVEKSVSIRELLSCVGNESIPIVLLDWNVVMDREGKGYQGHFVPVVGYDEEYVYVHNHGFNDTKEFFLVRKEVFDKARKAKGTDEDILIVYKNN